MSDAEVVDGIGPAEADDASDLSHDRRLSIVLFECLITAPLLFWLVAQLARDPAQLVNEGWAPLVWAAAVTVAELLPVPTNVSMAFSLSFPLELSAALLFPTPVAALIALVGSADQRELRGELPLLKAVFIRSQIALSVVVESLVFKIWVQPSEISDLPPWALIAPTLLAAMAGYATNTLIVAVYYRLQSGRRLTDILREMHEGIFGEFVASYMGLALFAVLVASAFAKLDAFAIIVFAAPLAFARQMFRQTHSLQESRNELAVKQAENEHQALHDALTGLPNRTLFQQRLTEAIEAAHERGGSVAVMLIDLDHFKEVNDTLGHHFGDLLLQEVGPRMANVLRDEDLLARLGGDEFGIVLPDLPSDDVATAVADRLIEELEHPVAVEGLALDISGSIGIARYPAHANDAETLMRRADVAMYAAKESGVGHETYHEDLDRHNPQRLTLIGQVRPALEAGEFVMYYQPKVRLSDGRVSGAEALIRWEHPTLGVVPPDEFVPLVEKTVLLRPLTHYVMDSVLQQWREWSAMGVRIPVAVNVSPRSLLDADFPDEVAELLRRWDVPPAFLRIELTESFFMSDSGRSTIVLDRLSAVGVSLAIDDFGTGYSSMAYLKRLPIEEIKVDRSFVMQMHVDANDFMIVRATVDLGRNLGLRVVAEGVEDLATFDRLAEFGCDEAQGYYISRPLHAADFTRWLSVRNLDTATDGPSDQGRGGGDEPTGRGRLHVV
jgi:diguanylate cyclase (GGDEF)-like protein